MTKTNNTNKNTINTNNIAATPVKTNALQTIFELAKNNSKIQYGTDYVNLVDSKTGRNEIAGFAYNGEDDREGAIALSQYCMSQAESLEEGKRLTYQSWILLINNYSPDEVITGYNVDLYLNYKAGMIVGMIPVTMVQYQNMKPGEMFGLKVVVSLTDEEKKLFKSKPQIKHILLEKLEKYEKEQRHEYIEEQCCGDEDEEDYDSGYEDGYKDGYDEGCGEGFGDGKQYFADKYLRR